jgi:DNA repair exonuclease SbcCD nuclease subunit
MLREAEIPVLAIEGNHDYEPYGTKTSWLRYLAESDRLILLEPEQEDWLDPWEPGKRVAGYIDLDCGVRVIGSRWYRSSASQMIQKLAASIQQLPPSPQHTVVMFHHGLEGQISRYTGALRYTDLLPLRRAGVDYLALGHIHKNYTAEDWIFNPGSVEANSVAEGQDQNPRGVYLVEIGELNVEADDSLNPPEEDNPSTTKHVIKSPLGKVIGYAELKREYYQRSIVRLRLEVSKDQTREDLKQAAIAHIQAAAAAGKTQDAIVELQICGQVGFNRLDLNVRELQEKLRKFSQALIFLLKYDVVGTRYETHIAKTGDELPTQQEIETTVFLDLVSGNPNYKDKAAQIVANMIELKESVVEKKTELNNKKKEAEAIKELYALVEGMVSGSLNNNTPGIN